MKHPDYGLVSTARANAEREIANARVGKENEELRQERDGWKLKAELLIDYPVNDATDAAHPAWWRGNDMGVASATRRIQKTLDGKDDGSGVIACPELEKARRDVLELRRLLEVAMKALTFIKFAARNENHDLATELIFKTVNEALAQLDAPKQNEEVK